MINTQNNTNIDDEIMDRLYPRPSSGWLFIWDILRDGSSNTQVYCNLRKNASLEEYIEVVFYNPDIFCEKYKRYILQKNCRYDYDTEKVFLELLRNGNLTTNENDFDLFKLQIDNFVENSVAINGNQEDIGRYIENIYFVLQNSGSVKELLYKRGLYNVAYYIDILGKYNENATTVEDIFNIDISLLKCIDVQILGSTLFEINKDSIIDYERFVFSVDIEKYEYTDMQRKVSCVSSIMNLFKIVALLNRVDVIFHSWKKAEEKSIYAMVEKGNSKMYLLHIVNNRITEIIDGESNPVDEEDIYFIILYANRIGVEFDPLKLEK